MKKNDIVQMEVKSISSDGNGVGRFEGMAVFVPKTAAGDVISCRIVKVCKKYAFGITDKIISPSECRTDSRYCSVFGKCGGCVYRHIDYASETAAKEKIVRDAFAHLGKLDIPFDEMIPCENTEHYRNKAQYPLSYENGKAVYGFYAARSHRVIPCGECGLQPSVFSDIADDVCGYINSKKLTVYDEKTGKGTVRHLYLRRGHYSGEIMVCVIVSHSAEKQLKGLCSLLTEKYGDIKSIVMNINPERTNVITGEKCVTLWGSGRIADTMCGNRIFISPLSFYQVNTPQAEKLYGKALEYAHLTGAETVLDLYCGTGTVGLSAARYAKKIIGCEIIPQAVENARENAAANNISNADFFCGDAGDIAEELADKNICPDVIITDPPRKGCDEKTLLSMVRMSPRRIVMISCNPATAAKDTAFLAEKGYAPVKVSAVDMFPGTGHVETVVLLSKGEIESKKVRVEFSLEDMDMSGFKKGATYEQIKEYVSEKYQFKVSSLYISQVKLKCGLEVDMNYNLPKSENAKQPQCPPDKEQAIREALEHFGMI